MTGRGNQASVSIQLDVTSLDQNRIVDLITGGWAGQHSYGPGKTFLARYDVTNITLESIFKSHLTLQHMVTQEGTITAETTLLIAVGVSGLMVITVDFLMVVMEEVRPRK